MKSGICPKCGSRRVMLHNAGPFAVGGEPEYYTCADCAYTEWYSRKARELAASADGETDGFATVRWVNKERGAYR
jgi:predicted nucleic-acid-binding Zn-ribbon protein